MANELPLVDGQTDGQTDLS